MKSLVVCNQGQSNDVAIYVTRVGVVFNTGENCI